MNAASGQAGFARALGDPAIPPPDGIGGPAAASRFAVYRNNVAVSLARALARRFPVVERLVGTEFFAAMAQVHARLSPPTSPVMIHYGEAFPAFVATFPPAASLPYLADVARLEAAWTRAYHAADDPVLAIGDLAGLNDRSLGRTRFTAHAAVTVIRSDWPVGTIWAAHQEAEIAPLKADGAESVLVVRPGLEVGVHILPAAGAAFAAHLFDGLSILDAALATADEHRDFDPAASLIGLAGLGAFTSLNTQPVSS